MKAVSKLSSPFMSYYAQLTVISRGIEDYISSKGFKDPALAAEEEDLAISSAATAYSGTHRLSFHSNRALIQIYIQPV